MNRHFIPYNKNLKQYSRDLRNNSTMSEILLWMQLRGRKFRGYQFNRQKLLDNYIADFYCRRMNLVIEIDGDSHDSIEAMEYDKARDEILERHGLTVIRIADIDVKRDMNNVLRQIDSFIDNWETANANPPNPL